MRWLIALAFILAVTNQCLGANRIEVHPGVNPAYLTKLHFPATYFIGVPFCGATALMLAAAITPRDLTTAEAWSVFAGCVVPVVGGMIMRHLFELHPEWNVPGKVKRLDLGIGSQS